MPLGPTSTPEFCPPHGAPSSNPVANATQAPRQRRAVSQPRPLRLAKWASPFLEASLFVVLWENQRNTTYFVSVALFVFVRGGLPCFEIYAETSLKEEGSRERGGGTLRGNHPAYGPKPGRSGQRPGKVVRAHLTDLFQSVPSKLDQKRGRYR